MAAPRRLPGLAGWWLIWAVLLLFGSRLPVGGRAVRIASSPGAQDRSARLALLRERVGQAEQVLADQLTQALTQLDSAAAPEASVLASRAEQTATPVQKASTPSAAGPSSSSSSSSSSSGMDRELSDAEAQRLLARLQTILGAEGAAAVPREQAAANPSLLQAAASVLPGMGTAATGATEATGATPGAGTGPGDTSAFFTGGMGSTPPGQVNVYGLASPGNGWMLPIRPGSMPQPQPVSGRTVAIPETVTIANPEALDSGYSFKDIPGMPGPQAPGASQFALGVPPFGFMPPAGLSPSVAAAGAPGAAAPQAPSAGLTGTGAVGGRSFLEQAAQGAAAPVFRPPAQPYAPQPQARQRSDIQWLGGAALLQQQQGLGGRSTGTLQGGYEMPSPNSQLGPQPWAAPPY